MTINEVNFQVQGGKYDTVHLIPVRLDPITKKLRVAK